MPFLSGVEVASSGYCRMDRLSGEACAGKGKMDVAHVAETFGGGGTNAPAGARWNRPLAEPCVRFFPIFAADLPYNEKQLMIADGRARTAGLSINIINQQYSFMTTRTRTAVLLMAGFCAYFRFSMAWANSG